MNALGIVLIALVTIAIGIAVFFLVVWVLVWNLTDMQNVGINFWNVFWSLLALSTVLGGTARAVR